MKNILKRREKGITLVVLVITIIILLILSGVAIMSISGENGLVFKAKQAKRNMEEAQIEENEILDDYYSKINEYIGNKNNDNSDELIDREYVEFAESNSSIINTEQSLFNSVNGVTLNKGETRKIEIPNNLTGTQLIIQLEAKYGRNNNSVAIYFWDANDERLLDTGTHFEYAGGTTEKTTKEYIIPQNCKYIEFWVGDGPYNPYMYIYEILVK